MLKKNVYALVLAVLFTLGTQGASGQTHDTPEKAAEVKRLTALKDSPVPDAVLTSYRKSYLHIRVSLELLNGKSNDSTCGGALWNKTERLVVTSFHCLPAHVGLLKIGKHFTANGSPAEVVAKLPEADLALLRVEKIAEDKEAIRTTTAETGSNAYVRSRIPISVMESDSDTNPYTLFFVSNWSAELTVTATGNIGFYQPKMEKGQLMEEFTNTTLKMYMFEGAMESGMSGSPIFNENGETIGIATSTGDTFSFGTDIRNVELLMKRYRARVVSR